MQRIHALARMQRQAIYLQRRNAGSVPQFSARWANQVRAESNTVTPDDPPTAPLHEEHELDHGQADFSNFLEKHEDVSTRQMLSGLGFIMSVMYGIYYFSTKQSRENTPTFTLREFPTVEQHNPAWKGAKDVRKSV